MIKHLVLSGGGPTGFLTYGAARYLSQQNFWSMNSVESIYGTSIGAFFGIILSLGLPWNYLDDYLINTKWDKVLNLQPYNFIDAYSSKGIVQPNFIRDSLSPLFLKKNIDLDINLEDFYKINNVDLHFYTTDINTNIFKKIDLSYKSHPELKLIKALEMSTAYPILFKPVFSDDYKNCYIDGGLLNNLPVNDCLEINQCDPNEVLVFKNEWSSETLRVYENSSIFDFCFVILNKFIEETSTENKQLIVPNTVNFDMNKVKEFKKGKAKMSSWLKTINDVQNRKYLIKSGEKFGEQFLNSRNNSK